MLVVPLIERKRDGGTLTPEEWSALVVADTARRQALDRRRRRQGVAGARAARGGVRRGRADDVGPRAGPHRRHPRQARGDPGVPHGIVPDGSQGSGDEARLRDDRADARDRPRRPPAVRAARRDGLGRACGNALETEEAILALRGEGPADLMEVTYALGVEMLLAAGVEKTSKKA